MPVKCVPHLILSLPDHLKWHFILTLDFGNDNKVYEGLDDVRCNVVEGTKMISLKREILAGRLDIWLQIYESVSWKTG